MIAFWYTLAVILTATLIPAYAALYVVPRLRFVGLRYLAAAGVGVAFWYFFDTMGDAVSLDENYPIYPPNLFGGLPHFALIGAFAAGVATLAIFDHLAVPPNPIQTSGGDRTPVSPFLIPAAIALVMGVHGLGEGWGASSAAASAATTDNSVLGALVQAFGSATSIVSYPIHKFLEASIIAVTYVSYVTASRGSVKAEWWHAAVLGALFGGPSVIGAAFGYFFPFDTSYFFAYGVTAALYAVVRLADPVRPEFQAGLNGPAPLGPKVFLSLAIGFLLLYSAALLH